VPSAFKSRLVVRSSLGAKATRDAAVVENGLVVTVGAIDLVQGLSDQECARRSPLVLLRRKLRRARMAMRSTTSRRRSVAIELVFIRVCAPGWMNGRVLGCSGVLQRSEWVDNFRVGQVPGRALWQ
jgi:hypothetical protein